MRKNKKAAAIPLFLLALAVCGCGYTTRSNISQDFRTINITPFANKVDITSETNTGNKYRIYRPGLETDITKSVISRFLFDGNLRPVNKDTADLVLEGELAEFRRDPLRYTESDEVEEYRVNIVVNIRMRDKRNNKLLWEERGFTGDTTYFPAKKSEASAINDAIADLSRRIVQRTVEQW